MEQEKQTQYTQDEVLEKELEKFSNDAKKFLEELKDTNSHYDKGQTINIKDLYFLLVCQKKDNKNVYSYDLSDKNDKNGAIYYYKFQENLEVYLDALLKTYKTFNYYNRYYQVFYNKLQFNDGIEDINKLYTLSKNDKIKVLCMGNSNDEAFTNQKKEVNTDEYEQLSSLVDQAKFITAYGNEDDVKASNSFAKELLMQKYNYKRSSMPRYIPMTSIIYYSYLQNNTLRNSLLIMFDDGTYYDIITGLKIHDINKIVAMKYLSLMDKEDMLNNTPLANGGMFNISDIRNAYYQMNYKHIKDKRKILTR